MDFENENALQQGKTLVLGDGNRLPDGFPLAVYQCDLDGRITGYNQAALRYWSQVPPTGTGVWCGAYKCYNATGHVLDRRWHPLARLAAGETDEGMTELSFERPDGTYCRTVLHTCRIVNEKGRLEGVYGTLTAIAEHGMSDTKQAMLSAIVEHSNDAIISKDLFGNITSWNKGAERIYGYREAEMVGNPMTRLIPSDRLSEEHHILEQIKEGMTIEHFQTIRKDKRGRLIPVSLTISPIRDASGQLIGASKIARDISEAVNRQKIVRKHANNMLTLNKMSKSISEKLDRDEIMREVVRAAVRLTSAAGGAFYFFPERKFPQPVYRAYAGDVLVWSDETVAEDSENWRRFMINPLPVRTRRRGSLAALMSLDQLDDAGKAVFLAVPLLQAAGNVVGKLVLVQTGLERFTPLDEQLIKSLAAYAAIALDNARLFEEVNRQAERKDEFIAMAGHELKTPLTSISSYLQLLGARGGDAKVDKFLSKCLAQVARMQDLIEELLDVSRIESGNLELDLEPVDLCKLVPELVEQVQVSVTSHRIRYAGCPGECIVQADRKRMEQVFQNLIGNAVKYSPAADQVTVTFETGADECRFSVTDCGIGIPPGELERVFLRYYRIGQGKPVHGLGLGLYISRDIVSRHGGTLVVDSEEGKGSTFTVTLPK